MYLDFKIISLNSFIKFQMYLDFKIISLNSFINFQINFNKFHYSAIRIKWSKQQLFKVKFQLTVSICYVVLAPRLFIDFTHKPRTSYRQIHGQMTQPMFWYGESKDATTQHT